MILFILTPSLLFIAFLLLLLVSLSVPIIKTIYLFQLSARVSSSLLDSSASGSVNFGVWGYCTQGASVTALGNTKDVAAHCSGRHLGYTFDGTVSQALGVESIENLVSRTSTGALVLHPVACVLTFLTLLVALFMTRRGSTNITRRTALATLVCGAFAAFVTTLILLIDVIFVAIVGHEIKKHTDGDVQLHWGNAVWITLGSAAAIWLSLLGPCKLVFGRLSPIKRLGKETC